MPGKFLMLLLMSGILFSCKKDPIESSGPPPVPPAVPPVTSASVLLKEIVIPHLPSPFHAFEYNSAGQVIVSNYASGLIVNDVSYVNGRINTMVNRFDNQQLQYFYDNDGRANLIMYIDPVGNVRKKVRLTYDGRQLIKLERETNLLAEFILEKRMTFSYYADGNVKEVTDQRFAVGAVPGSRTVELYEEYDDKVNVDDFTLLHNEFFDQVILLPGVRLQKSNYRKLTHTGDGVHYRINYVYAYNDRNLPTEKNGVGIWLNGADEGRTFESNYFYSYY